MANTNIATPDWTNDPFFAYEAPFVGNTRNNFLAVSESMGASTMIINDILSNPEKTTAFKLFLRSLAWSQDSSLQESGLTDLGGELLGILDEIFANTNNKLLSSVKSISHAELLKAFIEESVTNIYALPNKYFSTSTGIGSGNIGQVKKIVYAGMLDLSKAVLEYVSNHVIHTSGVQDKATELLNN